jgi:anhydro-N-acetylmuramic acid kinase
MHYLGLMSGTSVDAIDAALVTIPAVGPLTVRATHRHAIPEDIQQSVHELTRSAAATLDQLGELDVQLGRLFAEAAQGVLVRSGLRAGEIRALGSHGQTVRHHPAGAHPFTLQLGNPSVIAELTRITTVADFRARDVAAGGQGAPLAPGFHAAQFRSPATDRVILNLGGIANITYLPSASAQPVIGFDTGPGNTLIDQWIYRHQQQRFDRDGAWAASGQISGALLERLLADPYFAVAPPKSTGREHFHLDWLQGHLAALGQVPAAQDVQATLLELTARSVARALAGFVPGVRELYVCGGGSHNRALMAALAERLPEMTLQTTEALGLHPDWVEAAAFAWLAHQTLEGLPGNLPSVTGAKRAVILGAIYRA